MSEYNLIKSFDIDNGELNNLSQQQCFVLGYELALIDELLQKNSPILKPVHIENKKRIEKSCGNAKRKYKLSYMSSDISESWLWLEAE